MPQVGQRVGEFLLDKLLGAGSFGEVWRASHHVWTSQLVAIKIPTDGRYVQSLKREGAAIHGLVHPNIVRAIGFDPYGQVPYLTMEYVPGTSLRPLIGSKTLGVHEALLIMQQVLDGLKFAHDRGVIHRDIKPENILVHERAASVGYREPGLVKVTDFGLGKVSNATTAGSIALSMSMDAADAKRVSGTLDYMSPEQRAGDQVDQRADLYACGVVLYEMLTGERPAGTEVPSDLTPTVPKGVDELFRRSYARLDKRFASADEFLDALARLVPPPLRAGVNMHGTGAPGLYSVAVSATARHTVCPQCRHGIGPGDQFCMNCGMQVVERVRRCGNCGGYPDKDDLFCIFCGKPLQSTTVMA